MNPTPTPTGKAKYAWSEITRAEPPKRPASDRIADFEDIYTPYDEATASEQASRCVQCPNPVCVEACPLGSPIPELLALTADHRFKEAAELLCASHSLPEVFAHICIGGRQCERLCVLGAKSDPVSIGPIARFLLNYAWQNGIAEPPVAPATGQRVAVIGSGVCGLVCADALSRLGHAVTVLDSREKPGGRVVNGLPGFRVDTALIERRVELLKHRGVQFRMNVVCGRDVKLSELRRDFDAILFAFSRTEPVPLKVPGARLKGVHPAHQLLVQNRPDAPADSTVVDVRGKRVVVLGGGDTAMDAARTAVRNGAADVLCIYRRDLANMPANPTEQRNAQEEGVRFKFFAEATAMLGNVHGAVTYVRSVHMKPGAPDESGRMSIEPIPGSHFEVPADVVFVAYGYEPAKLTRCDELAELKTDVHGHLIVDENQMTNLPGLFAAGSIVRGAISMVDVVRDARKAVSAVDGYLKGKKK